MATTAFLTYIFSINQRLPHTLAFNRSNGMIQSSDFVPNYTNGMQIDQEESVPFRLTPNLQHIVSDEMLQGVFLTHMMALGRALSHDALVCLHVSLSLPVKFLLTCLSLSYRLRLNRYCHCLSIVTCLQPFS